MHYFPIPKNTTGKKKFPFSLINSKYVFLSSKPKPKQMSFSTKQFLTHILAFTLYQNNKGDNLPIQIKQYKIRFEKDDDDSLPTDLKFQYQLLNANISATPGSEKTHTNSRFS